MMIRGLTRKSWSAMIAPERRGRKRRILRRTSTIEIVGYIGFEEAVWVVRVRDVGTMIVVSSGRLFVWNGLCKRDWIVEVDIERGDDYFSCERRYESVQQTAPAYLALYRHSSITEVGTAVWARLDMADVAQTWRREVPDRDGTGEQTIRAQISNS
jgi:hypothetical protein